MVGTLIRYVYYSYRYSRDLFGSIISTLNKNVQSGTRLADDQNIICYAKLYAILRVRNLYPCEKTMRQFYPLVAIKEQQHAESPICPKNYDKSVACFHRLRFYLQRRPPALSHVRFPRYSCEIYEYICILENICI